MKLILIVFLALGSVAYGQETTTDFVFPDFTAARVKFKKGNDLQVALNYNKVTEEMVYKSGNDLMAIGELDKIDTIFIAERKFVPETKGFREIVLFKTKALTIKYKAKAVPIDPDTGYGTTSKSLAPAAANIKLSNGTYTFYNNDKFHYVAADEFYLKTADGSRRITGSKSLETAYPGRLAEVNNLIKEQHLDIKQRDGLVFLITLLEH